MGHFKLSLRSIARLMLFSAAAFLVCGTARGTTPVNGFVIINPISVCSGGICAAYGVSCTSASGTPVCTKSPAPSLATTTTPIGFVDKDKNVNLTRAFWAQAGIDVVFFPVQSYNSPTNTIPSSWNNIKDASTGVKFTYSSTNYQTLHLVNVPCALDNFVALTSPDFEALTQHSICNDHGGLGPGYTNLSNPPPVLSPAPPLAINGCGGSCSVNSNAIDVFFVNSYGGTGVSSPQYGFSWINGDGVSIGSGAFTITQPRYDTLAHEIGHALALTHLNFGATTDTTNNMIGNMMLLGSTRATSYNSGCQNIMGNFSNPPPILNNGALYDLDYMTSTFDPCMGHYNMLADHLTPGTCPSPLDPATCNNQEGAAALSPFINATAPNTANAGGGQSFLAAAATTSTPTPSGTGTPAPLQITITADGDPNDSNVPDLASTIIAIPPSDQLSFNGNSPVTQIGGTSIKPSPAPPCAANNLSNCAVTVTSVVKLTNQQVTGNPGCDSGTGQPPSSQCVKITYSVAPTNGFGPDNPTCQSGGCPPPGIFVVLAVSFNKDQGDIISNNLLTGTQYTSIDANGFATTTLFGPVFNNGIQVGFNANSANPDLTTANVLLNASTFQNAAAVKYGLPPFNNRKLAQCTPPFTTVFVKIKGQLVPVMECPDGNLPDGPD